MKIYSIYDSKADLWQAPFTQNSRGECLRNFETFANDPQSNLSKYGADFTLFEIGGFDVRTGQTLIYEAKISLGTALELKKLPHESVVRSISEMKETLQQSM